MTTNPPASVSGREALLVALACVWFGVSAWTAAKDLPAVADEIAHITGGESYWRYGINHLQPENGYVAMHWATIPLRLHPPVYPVVPADLPGSSAMIVTGNRFFYELGNDPALILARGRAMMTMMGMALVGLIWWSSRRVWGPTGALLSVGLAAFCPTLLANSPLVMSDVTLSLFLLLTTTLWWTMLRAPSFGKVVGCGLALGVLLLCKMSGVLAGPILVLLALIRYFDPEPLPWSWRGRQTTARGGRKFFLLAGLGLTTALIAAGVLWAAFGFRFSMFANPAAPQPLREFTWEVYLRQTGLMPRVVGTMLQHKLLPEGWLNGLASTFRDFEGRQSFLNGRFYIGGDIWYFPYAFLVKTPLALLGLLLLSFGALHQVRWRVAAPLLVLSALYWIFALTASINIGHRHLMPVYAVVLVLAGGAAAGWRQRPNWWRGIIVLLAGWFVIESTWVRPRYLSYFNQIAGGPANGYRHLVDSNVDCGQDLEKLRDWLTANVGAEKVFLTFFGPADPVAYGIKATRFSDNGFDARRRMLPAQLSGGVYCMSVTLFQGMYTLAPGPWTAERETRYRELLTAATTRSPTGTEALWIEQLQFCRMRHVLAGRSPTARPGDSILVFRLSDNEVAWMLYAPLTELERIAPVAPPPR